MVFQIDKMTKKYAKIVETFITRFSKECMIGNQNTYTANILFLNFSSFKDWVHLLYNFYREIEKNTKIDVNRL